MARTLDQLAIIANQIKDATLQGENTADRVGGLLVDLIDFLRTINVDEITLSPLLTALNESGLVDPQDGQILRFKSSEDNWVFSSDITQITSTIRTIIDTLGQLDNRFVKKTGDIMTGLLTTLAGIKVRNFLQLGDRFVSGLLGEGAIFRENIGGRTYLEADEIYIRVKAYFDTVEIKKFLHSGGNRIASLGGAKCVRVEMLNSNNEVVTQNPTKYRCYFRASDGDDTITNDFVVGDQAYCHVTNATNSSLSMHHYWRLVIGKNELPNENGEHWIDLSNQESETIDGIVYSGYLNISDAPAAQDDIIQLGNVNDSTRRGAIIEFVSGNDAPAYQIFQDLGSIGSATTIAQKHDAQYSYNGKNYISMGYSSSTGRAFMNVYGDFLFGDPEESTYVKYNAFTKQLDIKATVHFISPTTHQETTLDTFASAVTGGLESLQRQIDGEIDTWFYNGTPGPSVLPESEWVAIDTQTGTNNERLKHLGDLYYDNSTGYAYRYTNTGSEASPVFTWSQISDSAVIKALEDAAKAQATADHKRRVFITAAGVLPTPPYSEGDLWMNVTYPANATITDAANNIYHNDILRCKVPATYNQQGELVREGVETGETALITHWQLSSKYTDDSKFDYFFTNTYSPFVTSIQQQVDRKAETYRQATNPASSWADADKPKHVGDLWMDTSANGGNKTYIYQNTGTEANPNYQWVAQAVPEEVFDKIDGKAAIYVGWEDWIVDGVSQLQDKDLYIPNTDHNPYKTNKVYRWRASDSTWNEIHYTDDTTVNNFISGAYATFVSNIQEQVDKKAETWRQSTDPSLAQGWVASSHVGDIWMDTDQNNGHNTYIYVSNGGGTYGWEPQAVPDEVFDEIDGKAEIFVQKPTTYHERDMWIIESSTTTCPDADIPANCKRGDIVVASSDSNSYNKTHWAKKDRYTDDTVANSALTAITNLSNNPYVQDLIGGGINQAITDGDTAAVQQAAQAAQTTYGYLTQALNQDTVIEGGLVLTSLIALRDRNSNVWSGISGTYINRTTPNPEDPSEPYAKGHGIAAWYGGENIDHEAFPALTNYAKSLFRFDGSGYLASGNITWDDSGNLIVQGQAIKATTYYLNGQNITDALNAVLTMFTLEGAGTAANPYVIKANFGLYSVGGITALGQGSQGGGGGGQGDVTWALLANNSDTRPIAPSHLTGALAGYATQSWVQQQGYITSIEAATASALGGIKVGYTTSGKNYKVQLDSSNNAFVNVPWENTTYTLAGLMGSSAIGSTTQPIYWNGSAFANTSYTLGKSVPSDAKFTDTTYSAGAGLSLSGTTFSIELLGDGAWFGGVVYVGGDGVMETGRYIDFHPTSASTLDYNVRLDAGTETTARTFTFADTAGTLLSSGNSSVSLSGSTLTVEINGTSQSLTNTWRGIQNNLTSSSTTDSLSAYQGYLLANGSARDNTKLPLAGGTLMGTLTACDVVVQNNYSLKIGGAYLTYDSTNNAIRVSKNADGTGAANFYAIGGVSALGMSESGGGGGQGDVTWTLLADNNDTRPIALSHIQVALNGVLANYLPLSGGTMTGGNISWNDDSHGIYFYNGCGIEKWNGYGPHLVAEGNNLNFWIRSGTDRDNRALIIHSGNIGSQSVNYASSAGNADTVDGEHSSAFLHLTGGSMGGALSFNARSGGYSNSLYSNALIYFGLTVKSLSDTTTYYPWLSGYDYVDGHGYGNTVVLGAYHADNNTAGFYIGESWDGAASDTFYYFDRYGNATFQGSLTIRSGNDRKIIFDNNDSETYWSIISFRDHGSEYGWLGTGGSTDLKWNGDVIVHSGNIGSQSVNYATTSGSCSGNAASATQLQTARNIWGQSFDGTGNVNGTITINAADWDNDYGIHINEGGSESYGFDIMYGYGDLFKIARRNGSTTATNSLTIHRTGGLSINEATTIYSNTYINNGLLQIHANSNSVTIGSQNSSWCHIYNSEDIPFIFNRNVFTIGGLYPWSASYDIGSTSYRWGTAYVSSINSSGDILPSANITYSLGSDSYRWEHIRGKFLWAKGPAPAVYVSNESGNWMALHWGTDSNRGLFDYTDKWIVGYDGTNTYMLGGNVGIGTSSPSYKLHVAGDIYATGGVTSLSDARHKTIMGDTKLRVEQIADMPAITYKWSDRRDNDLHVGSIAQNWQRILPEVVSVANDLEGTLSINYGVAAMIASIVTAKKVVDHEARIKALESECERLREENKQLRLKIA